MPSQPRIVVFAPSPILTVTIEEGPGGSAELHLHAGGSGPWVARMAEALGAKVTLCVSLGGETGGVLESLLERERAELAVCPVAGDNGAYVHDRRSGMREPVVDISGAPLSRHEADDLFGVTYAAALHADALVLSGPQHSGIVAADVYTRLAADAREGGVPVVGDLTGPPLWGALAGGITLLKLSDEELRRDGLARDDERETLIGSMDALHDAGAETVIVSRGPKGSLAQTSFGTLEAVGPRLTAVEPRGSGDAMTGALAYAAARRLPVAEALRLGTAAGAVNAGRHGLGTGARANVEAILDRVRVRRLDGGPSVVVAS